MHVYTDKVQVEWRNEEATCEEKQYYSIEDHRSLRQIDTGH